MYVLGQLIVQKIVIIPYVTPVPKMWVYIL